MVRGARSLRFAVLLFGALGSPLLAEIPDPRPISPAERRAVELATGYLAGGPEAWWPELAAGSPLRDMGEEVALDEIAVRAGPPSGARWMLQTPAPGGPKDQAVFSIVYPSGVEETLAVRLVEEAGGWKIEGLRSLADPSRAERFFWEEEAAASPSGSPDLALPKSLAPRVGVLMLVGIGLGFGLRRRWVPGVAAGLAGALVVLSCTPAERPDAPLPDDAATEIVLDPTFHSIGFLRELRWALASGAPAATVRDLAARVPVGRDIDWVVSLWRAETELSRVDLGPAEDLLASLPDPAPIPLGDLLRARLAYVRGEADRMTELYEQLERTGIDHDGLRFEAGQALASLGRTIDAELRFEQAAEMGSRLAEVHYAMASFSALNGEMEDGEDFLSRAWSLEPVPREVLFGEPLLATLCARPSLFPTFSFDLPEEPLVVSADRGGAAIDLPAGAATDLSGELLRIEVGDAEVFVPGASALARANTALETAADRRARLEERVLARLPELQDEARTRGALARPRRLREMAEAAAALARHNRWEEIVRLTGAISGEVVEVVPPALGQLRAVALQRTGRTGDAQKLLVRLAKTSLDSRRKDPGALRQLAELFVAARDYDLAIRLMRRAGRLSPLAASEARIRQVRMEQRLYESSGRHRTDHFDVVYPRATGPTYAGDLGMVLEEERLRLSRWISGGRGVRHTVHVYPLVQFLEAYSNGILVLGIYDGRLSVPFAELRSLHPELVSVLSHELAHAMLAEATGDQAPKWLHEGLAQHVEMMPGRINPIPDLHREGRILAFPMIEAILAGFGEAQLVDLAYGEAAWVVHYIEAKHGVRAIHRLIGAYAEGRTTEEALREVFDMSVAELDRAVWSWCLHEAPDSWPTRLRRYDQEAGQLVRRTASNPAPDGSTTVRDWHALYASRTRSARRTLSRLVGPVRQGRLPARETCAAFREEVSRVLDDPGTLAAPPKGLSQHLQLAFRSLYDVARSCEEGDAAASRESLRLAESALARAAGELEEYGLRP